jgi:RHS repeat-associated protein
MKVVAIIDLDAWGGETNRSWGQGKQSYKFTSYERDGNGNDQAMFRQYHSYWQRFDQPDPYDGSANITDPQSLNRYSYVQNDPVNFVDPSGLNMAPGGTCYAIISVTIGSESQTVTSIGFEVRCYGGGGGGGGNYSNEPGGGGGRRTQEPSKPSFDKPACPLCPKPRQTQTWARTSEGQRRGRRT